jgi:hypothetical protein
MPQIGSPSLECFVLAHLGTFKMMMMAHLGTYLKCRIVMESK